MGVILRRLAATTAGYATGMQQPPSDETTLTEVIDRYVEGGFAGSFTAEADGTVRCETCGVVSAAPTVRMSSLRRLEGASEPDEMMAVVALTCPSCSTQGTAILHYGPTASAEEADLLTGLRDDRGDDRAPANSAPGETVGDSDET
jgi:hypothetical protein